jgi:carbon monoxide dehydrogenase subunit G
VITVERTVEVARPVPAVFAFLADFTNTEQWDPGTVSTTRTDDGPLRVGATFHNVSQFGGRRTELDYRIVRFEVDTRLTFTGDNRTVEATDDLTFSGLGDTTVITYRAHFRFKRWARLAEPFLRSRFEPIADETVEQLRTTLEAQVS